MRKRQKTLYYLTKDKILHFYQDCKEIVGHYKHISSDASISYKLCKVCQDRHSSTVHTIASDLENNQNKYNKEFLDNVEKANLPGKEKEQIIVSGLFLMALLRVVYNAMDSANRR